LQQGVSLFRLIEAPRSVQYPTKHECTVKAMVEIIEKLVAHDDWLRCMFACGQVEVWKRLRFNRARPSEKAERVMDGHVEA
jgi:hypothetical protein